MRPRQLQKEGIKCNMTLLFSLPQAVRAAEAKVQLISPFVGRIYDWFKAANKRDYAGRGRSRRAIGPGNLHLLQEVRLSDGSDGRELPQRRPNSRAGRLRSAHHQSGIDERACRNHSNRWRGNSVPKRRRSRDIQRLELDEKKFRYLLNDDAMATEKTAEGIRKFAADIVKLEKFVASKLGK